MQRDMDLVREMLLRVEGIPMKAGDILVFDWNDELFDVPGHSHDDVINHFSLLMDAGFINAPATQGMTAFVISGLSWSGHEFLASIKNPEVWEMTKQGAKKAGGFSLSVMTQLAGAYAKQVLASHLGIQL